MISWLLRASAACLILAPVALPAQSKTIAPLGYQGRTLPNGLQVYSIRDPKSANVSVQLWYKVGSRDDPAGRSGFAHLFEHLMFKSTRNMVPEQFDRMTEDVGGFNNAGTSDDYTNYYEVVPANHLQRLLWAEAERMRSLVIEPGFFASERDVVKEELRSRVLAAPYGRLFYLYFPQVSYDVDPYARPGIGSIEDLDAATIDDVRAFHATYYRPDNAVLVVAGNFDQADLDKWIDGYFKPIVRPATKIPRVSAKEPVRTKARHYTIYEPNTPLPAVALTYPIPPASDKDSAAIELMSGILSTGESSRLHQALVYRDQIATSANSYLDVKQGPGLLAVFAILSGGKSAEDGEAALRREIARLRDTPVTEAELREARNELVTGALRERETVEGQASALAKAVVLEGDPAAADRRLAAIAAVTPADVRRVARKWLVEARSASIRYLPEEAQKGAPEDRIATAATVKVAALVPPANIRIWTPASDSERIAPPAPGREIVPVVPRPNVQKLANGMTVVTVEDAGLPLVTATLVAVGGSAADPAGKAGTASLAASVMTEGTSTRSATQIDAAVEALGASIEGRAGWDGGRLALTTGTGELDRGVAILADLARNATLPAEEIERQRAIAIDGVAVARSNPGTVARQAAARALYGVAPYGHPASGTAASLRAITRTDVERAYRGAWTPATTTLILSGDVTPDKARVLADLHFANWQGSAAAPNSIPATAKAPLEGNVIVIDMPKSGQAAVAVARNGIARRDPRYFRAAVANAVLGGGYSARLNQEIRIRRGLSYGSGSSLGARRNPGPFVAVTQTRNDAADQVLALTLAEMKRLGTEPVAASELNARRSSLTGGFGRSIETTAGTASLIADTIDTGLPLDAIQTYLPSVLAVGPNDVQSAASDLLHADGATIVIVGESAQFIDKLRKLYPKLVLIPLSELNLDSPTLR